MKKLAILLRKITLGILFMIAVLNFFSIPDETSPTWFAYKLKTLIVCAVCLFLMALIYKLWHEDGTFDFKKLQD